jgi:L-asparaginase II
LDRRQAPGDGVTNPVLVEVTRGPLVESRHRGAIVVVDASGKRRAAIGDVEQAIFPRSAVKALQALPLVESGAADRYGFGTTELALACSSHNGEPRHVATVLTMLAAAGRGEADLECGAQIPSDRTAADALVREGKRPSALHNNCSGKHAGFICFACHTGIDVKGYVAPDHPVQREIAATMEAMTGARLTPDVRGVDGCSIPTWAIPLDKLALALARLVTGEGLSPARTAAAHRLVAACAAEPFMVAGTGRLETDALSIFGQRLFIKGGAEGVCCAGFPDLGLGVALKCDDGAGRAADTLAAAVIDGFLPMSDAERAAFADWLTPAIMTRRGVRVGEVRPVAGLVRAIRDGGAVS